MGIIDKIKGIKLTRNLVILILITGMISLLAIMSISGSKTKLFGEYESDVEYRDDPAQQELPRPPGSYNLSQGLDDFPNPSDDWDDIGSIVIGDDVENGTIKPPDPTDTGGSGSTPTPTPTPSPTPTPPSPSETPKDPNEDPDVTNEPQEPINVPERQNKARNLINMSEVNLFGWFNLGFFDSILPSFDSSLTVIIFVSLLFSIFYYPNTVLNFILTRINRRSDTEDEEDTLFFKPTLSEKERKRQEERMKKLMAFSDYVDNLIEEINQRKAETNPEDLIVWAYHELDSAFAEFSDLRRSRDLTPLEHSHLHFTENEINNDMLEDIVQLFYLTRFGQRKLKSEHVQELLDKLGSLVPEDNTDNKTKSRWSIF